MVDMKGPTGQMWFEGNDYSLMKQRDESIRSGLTWGGRGRAGEGTAHERERRKHDQLVGSVFKAVDQR